MTTNFTTVFGPIDMARLKGGPVERVARALCMMDGEAPLDLAPDHMMDKERAAAGNPTRRWETYTEAAEAAIVALIGANIADEEEE